MAYMVVVERQACILKKKYLNLFYEKRLVKEVFTWMDKIFVC